MDTGLARTLYLNGTVFFDGNLTMDGADYIKLAPNSNGTVFVYGYLQLTNDGSICAYFSGTTCSPGTDAWNPGRNPNDPVVFFGVYVYNNGNSASASTSRATRTSRASR